MPRDELVALLKDAIERYRAQCFDSVAYDLECLDAAMARRVASRLCARGGRDGFVLGRQILDASKWL